jgi:hypothetical protein
MSTVEDGWDDDDDGFFGSDDEDATGDGDTERLTTPTTARTDAASKDEFVPPSHLQPSFSSSPAHPSGQSAIPASKVAMELSENANNWWGDDDDALQFDEEDDDNDADDPEQPLHSRIHAAQPDSSFNPNWATGPSHTSAPVLASSSTGAVEDPLYQDLVAYLGSLEHLSSSINAVLEAEYNESHDKAAEILDYYRDRPGLAAYTVDKELGRMEYVVTIPQSPRTLPPTTTITDKDQIANLLRQQKYTQGPLSLLIRSANQSILADLLQVCTGPDRLVRPQYMASAMAQTCRFHLDLASERLHVEAHLSLSIPISSGRWEVAHVGASAEFVPREFDPTIRYRLDSVRVLSAPDTDPLFPQRARSAVAVLRECLHDHPSGVYGEAEATDRNFRDTFLQQSQNILLNSADGMQSAWKEFEQVAGIKSKLMNLPGFLPDDVLNAAEQETFTMHAEQQEVRRQVHEQQQQQQQQQRPTSILGGLVRSGFKKLAQQVALPTEDPSIYEDWSSAAGRTEPSMGASRPVPHHQAKQTPQLHLYNKDTMHSPRPYSHIAPADDDDDDPRSRVSLPKEDYGSTFGSAPPAPSGAQAIATGAVQSSVNATPSLDDGWGDEEDDLFEIEEQVDDGADDGSPPNAVDRRTAVASTAADDAPLSSKTPAERPRYLVDESKQAPPGWTYDPTTGIIPTRKRWTNPCPNPFPFLS